jgi:hypothetical protein
MFRHAVVTEVAPAPFRGERFSAKIRREALEAEKLEERLPRPALAVKKLCPFCGFHDGARQSAEMTGFVLSTSVDV